MNTGTLEPQSTAISVRPQFARAAAYRTVMLDARYVPAMDRLQTRCGTDNVVPRDSAYYAAHFAAAQGAVGIVDEQGALVAHALIRNKGTDTTMLNVLVDPEHRGQRLHNRMIAAWLENASDAGLLTASARVRTTAVASFKNFSTAGFETIREEPSPEAPHEMTHVMQKALPGKTPHLSLVEQCKSPV